MTHTLHAVSLNELIGTALLHHPTLQALEAKIEAKQSDIHIADRFENPQLLMTHDTLDDSQAMHKSVVSIKQKIPFFHKRDSKKEVFKAEQEILQAEVRTLKAQLVMQIKTQAYILWKLKASSHILARYIALTKKSITLNTAYTATDANGQMDIAKAKLSLAQLQIQKSTLEGKTAAAYARLSYLAAIPVKHLKIDLKMGTKPNLRSLRQTIQNSPDLLIQAKKVLKQNRELEREKLGSYPDINLMAGYASRDHFDDYYQFGMGIRLPIYGREKLAKEKARAMLMVAKTQKIDTKSSLSATLQSYYTQMLSSYQIYHIVQDQALPQIAYMSQLSGTAVSSGADLFRYIDVLFQKLTLEQKRIEAIADYHFYKAKLAQLKGAIK